MRTFVSALVLILPAQLLGQEGQDIEARAKEIMLPFVMERDKAVEATKERYRKAVDKEIEAAADRGSLEDVQALKSEREECLADESKWKSQAHRSAIRRYRVDAESANRKAQGEIERIIRECVRKREIELAQKLKELASGLGLARTLSLEIGGAKMEFVYIDPGGFIMGCDDEPLEPLQMEQGPPRRVEIRRGFYMGKYEVTRGQFAAFVAATRHVTAAEKAGWGFGHRDGTWQELKGLNWRNIDPAHTDDHPAGCIDWEDANAYCKWASAATRRNVRLPTEAEWEYACRAGTTTRCFFGDNDSLHCEYGWSNANSGFQSHPVGQKKPNAWGLHDMYGNVWEWCWLWWGSGEAKEPTGAPTRERRCMKGGGWLDRNHHSALRYTRAPEHRAHIGFRVVVQ